MNVKETKAKSIVVKSNLPGGGFVINPYTGCDHGCRYCYARFMKRFTGHKEEWGSFVDVKINASELIPKDTGRYKGKPILMSSVCDPYQSIEKKYRITRKVIEKLLPLQPKLEIITKSDLVLRDVDLLRKFKDVTVAISVSLLNEKYRKLLENAPPVNKRIDTLRKLHQAGIRTVLFVSPIFPELTDWREIVRSTKSFVDEYWFENLNLYPSIRKNIFGFLRKIDMKLVERYRKIYSKDSKYWSGVEREIREFCREQRVNYRIYFHHKRARDS